MDKHFIVIAEAGDFIGEQKLIAQHLKGEMKDGKWHMADGTVWEIIVTGVGAINVMKTLQDIPRNAQIINIGITVRRRDHLATVCRNGHWAATQNFGENERVNKM